MQTIDPKFRNEDGSLNVNAAVMEGRKARSREAISLRRRFIGWLRRLGTGAPARDLGHSHR